MLPCGGPTPSGMGSELGSLSFNFSWTEPMGQHSQPRGPGHRNPCLGPGTPVGTPGGTSEGTMEGTPEGTAEGTPGGHRRGHWRGHQGGHRRGQRGGHRRGHVPRPGQAAGAPMVRLSSPLFCEIRPLRLCYSKAYGRRRPGPPVTPSARGGVAPLLGTARPGGRRRYSQRYGPWPPRSTRGRRAAGPSCSARSRGTRTP